ncbi:hypothetical protein SH1V18_13130 [Vallitalea longa]|uniref:Uncharacterized protein n=1 Tax=Vallitalea longa TaxID=2936439 RepID=A0A9W6DEV5_9FIRM|nr:hypothetical protein [Vallitalea longa]GKX28833.1 hypothetical protein SH1V18_13130 [Vallitalea longa]
MSYLIFVVCSLFSLVMGIILRNIVKDIKDDLDWIVKQIRELENMNNS